MADKITRFEDYKKKDNTEEIDIQIEDPLNFFDEKEKEEYFLEKQKEQTEREPDREIIEETPDAEPERRPVNSVERKNHSKPISEKYEDRREDYEDDYDDEELEEEPEEEKSGFPIEFFIRISSIITGIVILVFLAIVAKVKIYDKYFAKDPDEVQTVVAALPAGFVEKNDTVTVTAQSLNLRTVASSESDATVVTSVDKGTVLKRIAVNEEGTWALVEYNGAQVYASMKYLSTP